MTLDIAVICEYPTILGGERSLLALLPGLREGGVRVHAIVPDGKLADAFRAHDAVAVRWAAGRNEFGDKHDGQAARELADILAQLKPSVVHANSLAMGRVVGPVCSDLGIASIAHLRDIIGLSRAAVAALNLNARLLAVSEAVRDFYIAAGMDVAKTHVAYNGVDLDVLRPRPPTGSLHRELGLSPRVRLVGAISQVSLRKGWDVLLDTARRVLAQVEDVAFVLVGACYSEKPETRAIERQLIEATRDYRGRIFLLGERDDVVDLLPELTMLAHAARQEPLGRVLLEAAATGLATVATDVGGTTEIFPPHANAAILVPPNDAAALAEAIEGLLDDEDERRRLGNAARRRAVQAFDVRTSAAELLRHYRDVVAMGQDR